MKKLLCATAVSAALAATVSTQASAAVTSNVYSNITGIQLWLTTGDLMSPVQPDYFRNLSFSGTATDDDNDGYIDRSNINLDGVLGVSVNGLTVRVGFDLTNGAYAPGSGITFVGGGIQIDVQTTDGWLPYGFVDASATNIEFLANKPGHMVPYFGGSQTAAGIARDTLPGLWDGVTGSAGYNRAAGIFYAVGSPIGIFLEGTIEAERILDPHDGEPASIHFGPPEVPIPGAVWLFGSSLLGLAGMRRLHRPT